MTPMRPQA
jgi:hypothetical protein